MHSNNLIHRDVKPGNILLTPPMRGRKDGCRVVLADFGLARVVTAGGREGSSSSSSEEDSNEELKPPSLPSSPSNPDPFATLTAAVCTRWYRPPEALFSGTSYSTPLDLWSAGCVLCELLGDGKVLFKGGSDIEQLYKVLQIVGDVSEVEGIAGKAGGADYNKVSFTGVDNQVPLEMLVDGDCGDSRVWRIIKGLVEADPAKRMTAKSCLEEGWFDEVRGVGAEESAALLAGLVDDDISGVGSGVKGGVTLADGERIAKRRRERGGGGRGDVFDGRHFTKHQDAFLRACC
jgi:serine/threonine protein kinase